MDMTSPRSLRPPLADPNTSTSVVRPSNRPVVCQLLHTLNVGGAEMLAARLARRSRNDVDFVFACMDECGSLGVELRQEGFNVKVFSRKAGLDFGIVWRLSRWMRAQRVDIIHAHQYTPFSYAMMARQFYRTPPVLFTEHGRHLPDFPRRKRIYFNRWMFTGRDKVVAVGMSVKKALNVNEGFDDSAIAVIYNGVDTAQFHDDSQQLRQTVRDELAIPQDAFVVIQVARLDYLKDHATGLRALRRIVGDLPKTVLVLVGEGPELASIEAAIDSLQIRSNVRLLGLRKDIPRLLAAADLFWLTSISEGIPLTVIEAMAAHVPVIATDVGGLCEMIENNVSGKLVPSGDDEALAAAAIELASDVDLRKKVVANAYDGAKSNFEESQMHARYLDLYFRMWNQGR